MAFDPSSAQLDDELVPATKSAFDPSSAVEDTEADQGITGTLWQGTKSAGRAVGSAVNTYTGNAQGVVDKALAQKDSPKDYRLEKFYGDIKRNAQDDGEDPGLLDAIGNVGGAVIDNPAGAGLAVLEQLPNAVPTLGGAWAGAKVGAAGGGALGSVVPGVGTAVGATTGGILGGLAGMFLGNAAIETGHKAMGLADDGQFTPEEQSQAQREGAVKGGVITAVDAATLGFGHGVSGVMARTTSRALEAATRKTLIDRGVDVADEAAVLAARQNPEISAAVRAAQDSAVKATDTLKRRATEAGTLMGMETVGEGVGEYLGELAATGKGNVTDAVLESLLSAGQSGAEAAWNMRGQRERRDLWSPATQQDPAATVQPTPTAENPAPAPVPRPDPNAGPLSRAASLLPASAPLDAAVAEPQPAPQAQPELQPEQAREQPAETGMAADDLTPYERNQLRANGVTDEQLWQMTTEQARAAMPAAGQRGDRPAAPSDSNAGQQPVSEGEARIREAIADVERRARLGGMTPMLAAERSRLGGELLRVQQEEAEAGRPRPAIGDQRSNFYSDRDGSTRRQRDPWVNPENKPYTRSSDPYARFPGIDRVPPVPLDGELLTDYREEPAAPRQAGIGADMRPRLMREGELMGGEVVPQGQRPGPGRGETFDGQNRAMPTQAQQRGITLVRAPLEGELLGGDLQAQQERRRLAGPIIEGELSPREQRALATTFRKRGAAEIARRNLPSPDRFTVEQQGSSWAVRPLPAPAPPITGEDIDGDWAKFSSDSGTLSVPRAEMPQIKAEHRGAMVNFLNARGVAHEEQTVPAASLKPTQAEFSREKVAKAKGFTGGDRSILVSSDGHVLDGHHQWLARRESGDDVKVIRLGAPIRKLLDSITEFPSATQDSGAQPAAIGRQPPKRGQRRTVDRDRDSVVQAAIRLGGITTQWKQDTTGDTKGNKHIPGAGALWSDKTGTSLDDMASLLDQHGYVPVGEMNKDGGVSWLQEAIRDEVAGSPRYAPDSARQIERAEQELLNRYAEAVARAIDEREAEYARIEAEYGPDAAADSRSFDEAMTAHSEQLDGVIEDARKQQETVVDGELATETDAARRDDELRQVDGREGRAAGEDPSAAFGLQQQTEAGLAEQDRQRQERERAEEASRRKAEQKAQADAEVGDFTLTGSDRPSDVGAARGQSDLFGAQAQQRTEQPQDFVPAPDGSPDFGEITTEMAQAAGRQAGKIRLQQGEQRANGTGYGLAHIEANHGKQIRGAGFDSVEQFVMQVARNFNQIRRAGAGQLLVAVKGKREDVLFVQLQPADDGDYYRINTAFPASRNYLEKQERKGGRLLWGGSEPAPTVTGQQPLYAGSPENDPGQDAPIAQGQSSNVSVAQPAPPSNWRRNYIQARQYAKALGVPVEKGQKLAEVVAQIEASLARAELDELAAEAQRRMAETAESAGVGVALSGAEIDYLTPAEKARRHELLGELPKPDSAEQARERIQERIRARRENARTSDDLPQTKRRNRPLKYTGYSGEARSVRSYQEAGDYRIASPHEGLFEIINKDGQAISQMAGIGGALQRVRQLMSGMPETASDVPLFSRAPGTTGMSVEEVEAAYQQLTQGMENAPLAKVVQSTAELPFDAPEDVLGAYWRGAIYLVADNIASAQDAREVVAHEMIGHYGMAGFFGRELRPTLERIHENNPRVRMLASKWRRDNQALIELWKAEYGMTDAQVKVRSIDEALAGMAEKGERLKGWNRLAAILQTLLRRMGATRWADALEARTDAEALLALKQAEMFVRRGMKKADPRPDIAYPLFVRARQDGLASSQALEEAKQEPQRYRADGREEGLPLAEVERAIAASPELAGVKVVQSFDDLPIVARFQALRDGVRPEQLRGVYSGGSTYVVANNHGSVADAVYTAVHEEVGHRGIRGMLGSEIEPVMQRLYASQATTVKGRQRIKQIRQAYARVLKRRSIPEQRLIIAEEMVAHLLEDGDQPTALQRVLSKMRELLRRMFPQVPWTYTDILALGEQSRAWLRRQQDGAGSSDRYSLSAMKSVEANIRRGRDALARAMADKTSVHRAMFRNGLGWIDFVWGSTGRVKPSGKTVGAMGLSHIFEARQRKDGLSLDGTARLLDEIVETIARGEEIKREEIKGSQTAKIRHGDTEAILTKKDGSNAWLVTGWKMRPDAGMAGSGAHTPTHASPTPAQGSMGADLSTPGTQRDTSTSGSPRGTGSTGKNDAESADVNTDTRYSLADEQESREALRKLGLAGQDATSLLEQIRNLTLAGLKAKIGEWSTRSEEGLFDGLNGIKRAEEAVGITSADRQGYVSARMASGIADVMHGVLHYAAPEWRDGVIAGKAGTRGVLEILGDLGPDNLTPWLAWLGGKRGQLLKAQGRENNLTDADIAALLAMGSGKEALFERVYRDYAKTNEAVLDLAEQAGLIDADARAKWATEYYVPFYRQQEGDEGLFSAPRTKRGLSHQTAAIRALKGGKLPTNDLLANMLAGWTKRIDAAMKNKALLEVVDNLKDSDYLADESPRYQQVLISRSQIATQIRKDRKALRLAAQMLGMKEGANTLQVLNELMKPQNEGFEKMWTRVAPTDPDIIRVQRAGQNEYYRVNDVSLLRGLRFMEGSAFNDPITRVGRAFKRILTTGVTASPDFILRNFIRDAAHAWMINKDGFSLGKDSIKGMRDALREDQDYRDLMFAGGSFQGGYVHGTDPEASAQIIRRALEKKGFTRQQRDAYLGSVVDTPAKAAAMLKEGWQKYRTLGDKVENANRLSTYKAALAAGKSKRQAAFEAKDLMDYSLRGNFAAAQWFTDVVPFLNARLQGLYKLGRAVKGDKTLIAKEVAMKGAYIALFSLLLAGLNDDDERYQELQDWDKDMHWHIFLGEEHFRIPKPFELGLLFGTVPERLLHALTGSQDGEDLAKAVAHGVFQTLAFNPVPQFYQPIRELQANRNFFRDMPIEDMGDEGKLPAARYDERTSALGRGLGQLTGPTVGLSPKQLDHLVMGYTGTLGGYVLSMSNLIAGAFSDAERPALTAGDIPVVKALYQGDAVHSTQYQTEFYDMLQEADQLYRTIRGYREEGKVAQAEQLLEESRDKLRHRPALGLARKQLGNVRTKMDQVYRDTAMDSAAKRQRLNDLQRQANQIAERVTRLAGGDF